MTDIVIRRLSASDAEKSIDALADILIDCVEGGASVGFMLPISRETARAFWGKVAMGVWHGERVLLVAVDRGGDGDIVGTVQCVVAQPQNQPHRADVAKMLVHRQARRRGVAKRLMAAVEAAAREAGKSVLVLDTETGGPAQALYEGAGWQRVGVVPDYALMPDGALCATTFFWKRI